MGAGEVCEGDKGAVDIVNDGIDDPDGEERCSEVDIVGGDVVSVGGLTGDTEEDGATGGVDFVGTKPGLTIMITVSPSLIPSYSFRRLLSAMAFPFQTHR